MTNLIKVLVVSDLHIEFHGNPTRFLRYLHSLNPDVDVLVMAGDIVPIARPYSKDVFLNACELFRNVILVVGNHELYYSTPIQVHQQLRSLEENIPNFHFLNRNCVEIEGVTFAGATTWFPDTPDSRLFQYMMNDFTYIKEFVPWVYKENERCIRFWEEVDADIWISHHAPSYNSCSDRYRNDVLNCYFIEPTLGSLASYREPKYLIHGHTHNSSDYMINQTRVICNPYGYEENAINTNFNCKLVLDL